MQQQLNSDTKSGGKGQGDRGNSLRPIDMMRSTAYMEVAENS